MSDIGYRLKGDSGPMYNPERDYAYITPTLMRQAVEKLDANDDVDRARWRAEQSISDVEIASIAEALAIAQRDFVNGADPAASFDAALNRHNFFNFRYCVRQYLWATVGEIFCAAWFTAVREVSIVGQESPAQTDMARFVAAVREFANKSKSTTYDANFTADYLRMANDTLRTRERDLLEAYKKKSSEAAKLQLENKRLEEELCRLKQPRGLFKLFSRRIK